MNALWGVRFPAVLAACWGPGAAPATFFFLLSGFVLTWNYAGDVVDARKFWLARACRVYPAYLALLVIPHWPSPAISRLGSLTAMVFLVQAWPPHLAPATAWGLSCLAFYYLLFPLLLTWLSKLRHSPSLLALAVAAWMASAAMDKVALCPPAAHLPDFVVGMVLARLAGLLPPYNQLAWLSALGALGLALGPGLLRIPSSALLILGLTREKGLASALAHPVMVRLGYASYVFYLLQESVPAAEGLARGLLRLMVITMASVALDEWFAEPLRIWLRRRTGSLPSGTSGRDTLVALTVLAVLVCDAWLLPEHRAQVDTAMTTTLETLGASEVTWMGTLPAYREAYAERCPGTRIVDHTAPYVLAPWEWEGARRPGVRLLDAEPEVNLALWSEPGTVLPVPWGPRLGDSLGVQPSRGVRTFGLGPLERDDRGRCFRWTGSHVLLDLPLPESPVHHVRLHLLAHPNPVEVRAHHLLWREPEPSDQAYLLDLPEAPQGALLRLELISKVFVPSEINPQSHDSRRLGAPLEGIQLLP